MYCSYWGAGACWGIIIRGVVAVPDDFIRHHGRAAASEKPVWRREWSATCLLDGIQVGQDSLLLVT